MRAWLNAVGGCAEGWEGATKDPIGERVAESLALETCGCGFTTSLELVAAAWALVASLRETLSRGEAVIGAELVPGVELGIGLMVGGELVTELADFGEELTLDRTLTTNGELVSKLDLLSGWIALICSVGTGLDGVLMTNLDLDSDWISSSDWKLVGSSSALSPSSDWKLVVASSALSLFSDWERARTNSALSPSLGCVRAGTNSALSPSSGCGRAGTNSALSPSWGWEVESSNSALTPAPTGWGSNCALTSAPRGWLALRSSGWTMDRPLFGIRSYHFQVLFQDINDDICILVYIFQM